MVASFLKRTKEPKGTHGRLQIISLNLTDQPKTLSGPLSIVISVWNFKLGQGEYELSSFDIVQLCYQYVLTREVQIYNI